MVAALLRQAGAEVDHSSPNYRRMQNTFPHTGLEHDKIVLVVRNWLPNIESMREAGHAKTDLEARQMVFDGIHRYPVWP